MSEVMTGKTVTYEGVYDAVAPEVTPEPEQELVPTMVDGKMMFGEVELIKLGDYWCDPDTGEVISLIVPKPDFQVTDADSAEWVLAKIEFAESEMFRLKTMLEKQVERLNSQINHHKNKADFMRARFGPELEQFAKANLPKGRKSWLGTHGSIEFTATPAKLDVEDEAKAIEFFTGREGCEKVIKTEVSVLKSNVPKELAATLKSDAELCAVAGLKLIPAGENMKINTGFKV